MDWEAKASAKRASLANLIPPEWKIEASQIPPSSALRDFAVFICGFLDPQELMITNAPASKILVNVRSRQWTAVDVTLAFCHRAAVAHQLVIYRSYRDGIRIPSLTPHIRRTASPRSVSRARRNAQGRWTTIFSVLVRSSDLYTVYPSVSRTDSIFKDSTALAATSAGLATRRMQTPRAFWSRIYDAWEPSSLSRQMSP